MANRQESRIFFDLTPFSHLQNSRLNQAMPDFSGGFLYVYVMTKIPGPIGASQFRVHTNGPIIVNITGAGKINRNAVR
jgi:hypothetical protein